MKKIGAICALYPTLATIVGVSIENKPNFITIGHVGILSYEEPQVLSVAFSKNCYSREGIIENGTFSICIPSEEMVREADYCGTETGAETDKAALFDVFWGALKTAPMIRQCPVSMELRLADVLEYKKSNVFIGKVEETHVKEDVLTDGKIDIGKVRPLLFDMVGKKYWGIGEEKGNCWEIGKSLP